MIRISRNISVFILPALILLLAAGCLKSDWEEKDANELKLIQQYLNDNGISEETKTEGGIYFVEEVAGDGLSPEEGDYVVINYVGRYLNDNTISETSYDSLKDDWEAAENFEFYLYGPAKFLYGRSIDGINEALSLMKEGGKAKIVIPSNKAYFDWNPLVFEIELIKVIKDPVAHEDLVLNTYITQMNAVFAGNGTDEFAVLDSIWYRESFTPDPADPNTVETGDTVLFRFSGKLLDGYGTITDDRIFDSNSTDPVPIKLVYGKTATAAGSGVILAIPVGLNMALDSMRVGTRATAVLPYRQAFGAKGLFNGDPFNYTIVPEYQTLVYDIEVKEIRRGPVTKK